ncbi:Ig-like domain-containing protein [Sodaliphilus sp.]|uniref:Ig-like domain-containing protein n=1 Tax=Sodaliphilus sp. TaxID=2815818 RepID=UPI00388E45AF
MKKTKTTSILVLLAAVLGINNAAAQKTPIVYINPGHGGHTSNDRNVVVPGHVAGDTTGFWESNASLKKGFALQEVLKKKGYKTAISRVRNEEEDDLNLSTIVALCNATGADVFFSLHSNATGAGDGYRINFPLGLYRGYTGQPIVEHSDELTAILQPFLYANKATVWTSNYAIYGDWTFYPDWNNQGLGVLRGNKSVAMLQEGSFHDYIPEAQRLNNDGYCWVEGYNVALATDKYFGRESVLNTGILTGCLRDDRILRTNTFVMHGVDVRESINNATVRLLDASGNEVARTTTDNENNGIYTFKYVTPGTYTVEASEAEHFTVSKQVEVPEGAPVYCNFDMKRQRLTPPEVVSYSPVWNDGDAPVLCNEPIVINFNWDMDVASTEAAFSITPAVDGTFTWEDTNYRMIFTPNDAYDINTEYTVTIGKSAQHGGGTPMEKDFSLKFKTQERNHLDPIAIFPKEGDPVHYQSVNVELRADSLLRSLNLYTYFHVLDKDGNEVGVNKRSLKNNKKGDAYGYIRIPLTGSLNVGEIYTLNIDRDVCDTVGIHLTAPISYKFTAVDAAVQPEGVELVKAIETADVMKVDGIFSSAALTASTTKILGTKSLQLKYAFGDMDDQEIDLNFAEVPETVLAGCDTLYVELWGDLSCNDIAAVLEPVTSGAAIEVPMGKLDFHGWRNVCVPVNLDKGDYKLKGLKLTCDKANVMGKSGTLLVDDINMKRGEYSGIENMTLDGVTVGPNPASDYLVAAADHYIQAVELYDLQGKLMVRNAANYVNVSGIASGAYVMKVYVNGLASTHKVLVKH